MWKFQGIKQWSVAGMWGGAEKKKMARQFWLIWWRARDRIWEAQGFSGVAQIFELLNFFKPIWLAAPTQVSQLQASPSPNGIILEGSQPRAQDDKRHFSRHHILQKLGAGSNVLPQNPWKLCSSTFLIYSWRYNDYGVNCIPQKFTCWSPNPSTSKLYLEILSLKRQVSWNETIRVDLNPTWWVPLQKKRKFG